MTDAILMPLAEAREYVYQQGMAVLNDPVADETQLLHAVVSLGVLGSARDRDTALSFMLLRVVGLYDAETAELLAQAPWIEVRAYRLLQLFWVLQYPPEVFVRFTQVLGIAVPSLDEVSDAFVQAFGMTREEMRARGSEVWVTGATPAPEDQH